MVERDAPLETLLSRRNAVRDIAAACGVTTAAVSQWRRVPRKHIEAVAQVMDVQPDALRPDLSEGTA